MLNLTNVLWACAEITKNKLNSSKHFSFTLHNVVYLPGFRVDADDVRIFLKQGKRETIDLTRTCKSTIKQQLRRHVKPLKGRLMHQRDSEQLNY